MAAMLCLVSGCSSHSTRTETGKAMILPAGAKTLDIPDNQGFLMAGPISNPLPEYPDELARTAPGTVAVCAEFVVESDGSVRTVSPLFALPECPLAKAEVDARFVAAVETTLRQWQFFAAATCTFPAGVARNHECEGDGVEVTPIAIKMAYVFTFRAEHGAGSVTGRSAQRKSHS